ncbi:MAG: outer membrane beta-barrel protein [Bacteroidota bacterium]
MLKSIMVCLFLITICVSTSIYAQMKTDLTGGIVIGPTFSKTESQSQVSFEGRAFARRNLTEVLQGEIGMGVGKIAGDNFNTFILPVDLRLLFFPLQSESWKPYLYAGFGYLFYKVDDQPVNSDSSAKLSGWAANVPVGIGMQFKVDEKKSFEISAGYNRTSTADLNAIRHGNDRDAFWNVMIGFVINTPK